MKNIKLLVSIVCYTIACYFIKSDFLNVISIFLFMLSNIVLNLLPVHSLSLIILTIGIVLKVFTIEKAFSCFSSTIVWHVVTIMIIAKAFIKSGLVNRITHKIVKHFGSSIISLCYGLNLANLLIASIVPSSAARIGGMMIPIIETINNVISTKIDSTSKIKNILLINSLYSNAIITPIFLTSITNLVIKSILADKFDINLSWFSCFINAICPAFFCLAFMPLVILYLLDTPDVEDLALFQKSFTNKLKVKEELNMNEKTILFVVCFLIFGWIISDFLNISNFMISLVGLSVVLLSDLLDHDEDIIKNSELWSNLLWLSTFILITNTMNNLNILDFLLQNFIYIANLFDNKISYVLIILFYGYSHYFFASSTIHVTTLYALFLSLLNAKADTSLFNSILLLHASNLFLGLTSYTSTEAVLITSHITIDNKKFYLISFLITTIIFIIWLVIGTFWWRVTGLL